jgi:hypothetical protein
VFAGWASDSKMGNLEEEMPANSFDASSTFGISFGNLILIVVVDTLGSVTTTSSPRRTAFLVIAY